MRFPTLAPALVAAALLAGGAPPAPAAGEGDDDPFVLKVNPLKKGIEGWEVSGAAEKAFAFAAEDSTLTFKGQPGKDPPRAVNRKTAWDRFEARMQVRKGTKRLRLVLVPPAPEKPVSLEIPSGALREPWNDVVLKVEPGKATLVVPDPKGPKTAAEAPLPAGARVRFGFEAPSGCEGAVTNLKFVRTYEDEPQVCEEGFVSIFPGTDMGSWVPAQAAMAPLFRVERGLLVGEVRTEDSGVVLFNGPRYRAYEFRIRALWATSHLEIRPLEVPGVGNQINRFESIHVNLTDSLDPEDWNDIAVRFADGACVIQINGKKILDQKVKPGTDPTSLALFVVKGKRFFLRDMRIKDLAPGEAAGPAGGAPKAPPPPSKEPEHPLIPWTGSGGFAEAEGGWEVAETATAGANLLCRANQAASYRLRFKVARGAEGLSVVPRANRGVDRAPGIRLPEAYFSKDEWTEVVLEMNLLTAVARVGGEEVGRLEVDNAVGPPGIRVTGGGRVRVKDLVLEPLKR